MVTKRKQGRHFATVLSLIGAMTFAALFGGCADVRYANNFNHAPEAKFNTYYAPDYYPYYPWDGYYGGAYYYGE